MHGGAVGQRDGLGDKLLQPPVTLADLGLRYIIAARVYGIPDALDRHVLGD
jgi:hypothetical protein